MPSGGAVDFGSPEIPPPPPLLLSDLPLDTLEEIWKRIGLVPLGNVFNVCTLWDDALESFVPLLFCEEYGLLSLVNSPQGGFRALCSPNLRLFKRAAVSREDTVLGLAIRCGGNTKPEDIKRANFLSSDHSLMSREFVFLPVSATSDIAGLSAAFIYCCHSRREFCIVGTEQELKDALYGNKKSSGAAAAAGKGKEGGEAEEEAGPSEGQEGSVQVPRSLVDALRRALRCDEGTARFYLMEAGGNLAQAMQLHRQEMAWEQSADGKAARPGRASRHSHPIPGPSLGRTLNGPGTSSAPSASPSPSGARWFGRGSRKSRQQESASESETAPRSGPEPSTPLPLFESRRGQASSRVAALPPQQEAGVDREGGSGDVAGAGGWREEEREGGCALLLSRLLLRGSERKERRERQPLVAL